MSDTIELFTVRLWQEALSDTQSEWRGKVQHVGTGEARYFRDWSKMMSFINDTLATLTGSQRPEVAQPAKHGRFRTRREQYRRSHPRWARTRRMPTRGTMETRPQARPIRQQDKVADRPNQKGGNGIVQKLAKLRAFLPKFDKRSTRVTKNLGVMIIATILFILGLNHIVAIDPKTTGEIFGSKPLLMGAAGIMRGISKRHPGETPQQ